MLDLRRTLRPNGRSRKMIGWRSRSIWDYLCGRPNLSELNANREIWSEGDLPGWYSATAAAAGCLATFSLGRRSMSPFVHGCACIHVYVCLCTCVCVCVFMYVCLSGFPVRLPHWSAQQSSSSSEWCLCLCCILSGYRMWCCIVLDMATCIQGITAAV